MASQQVFAAVWLSGRERLRQVGNGDDLGALRMFFSMRTDWITGSRSAEVKVT